MSKAIILVGGPSSGTRFRPLSMDCPKPLFPIAGSPTIYHHVLALSKVPVKEILLIGFYEKHVFDRFISESQIEFPKISFRYLREYVAMGTAGCLLHFKDEITRGSPDHFFVLNADIASSFPLEQMLRFHVSKGSIATLMGVQVPKESTKKYGCIVYNRATLEIEHFVEKPETFISDTVSCGVYLFSPSIFDYFAAACEVKRGAAEIDMSRFSLSKSVGYRSSDPLAVFIETDVLRTMTGKKGVLHAYICDENQFWMAVKTGSSTIVANYKYLQHFLLANPRRLSTAVSGHAVPRPRSGRHSPLHILRASSPGVLTSSPGQQEAPPVPELIAPVYIHPTAIIHPTAKIGPNVSIGPRALVGRGARIRDAILLDSVEVNNDAFVINAVVGWESSIGSWSRVEGSIEKNEAQEAATFRGYKKPTATILGKGVKLADEIIIQDCIVLPFKELKYSYRKEIIM
jgi:mannose-1-phosphate guanylyltransferase